MSNERQFHHVITIGNIPEDIKDNEFYVNLGDGVILREIMTDEEHRVIQAFFIRMIQKSEITPDGMLKTRWLDNGTVTVDVPPKKG